MNVTDIGSFLGLVKTKNTQISGIIDIENSKEFNLPGFKELQNPQNAADSYNKLMEEYFTVMKALSTNQKLLADCRRVRDSIKSSNLPQTVQVSGVKQVQEVIECLAEDQKTLLFIKDRLDNSVRYMNSVQYMLYNNRTQDKITY